MDDDGGDGFEPKPREERKKERIWLLFLIPFLV